MPKSKFFAFFNTEEQFLRFVAKYIDEHPAFLRAHDQVIRHFSRVWMLDHVTIALGRMGFSENDFGELNKVLFEVEQEYMGDYAEDLKDDKKMEYSRACLDRELKQYTGKFFVPEEERYK